MKMLKLLKWSAVWISSWTMLMTPVALGQEAKKVSKQQMQSAINDLGINKKITWGEFYEKNKHLIPVRVQNKMEPFIAKFKNQLLPHIEVVSSKTTSGEEVPTLRLSQGKELLTIQWFGQPDKMFKFQTTTISDLDVINYDDMFTRIMAGDEKYRKQLESKKSKPVSKKVKTPKYPDVTKAEWKSMSLYDKANYFVNFRLLWQDARKVLIEKEKMKSRKTSENFFEKNKYFYALFFGTEAEAVESADQPGKTCIVAGYVVDYAIKNNHKYCNRDAIKQKYGSQDLYQSANSKCSSSEIACNPLVYGTPGGNPICVKPDIKDQNFQIVSHWEGKCDIDSRLSSKEKIEIVKEDLKQARYENGNLLLSKDEIRKRIKDEQSAQNYELTEKYILGLLKFKGLLKSDTKKIFGEEQLTDEMLENIKSVRDQFQSEIDQANKSCATESKFGTGLREGNYWPACDQLQRRYLFINELFASKCKPEAEFNPNTLKCICPQPSPTQPSPAPVPAPVSPAPAEPTPSPSQPNPPGGSQPPRECVPGSSCSVAPPPSPEPTPVSPDPSGPDQEACSAIDDAQFSNGKCICLNGKTLKKTAEHDGVENFECVAATGGKPPKKDEECGFWCKYGGTIKTAALWIGGGLLAYFIFKQLAPKKPKLNPPSDLCPNGLPAPCQQLCAPPKKNQSNGTCGCDGCPPGQSADPTTCYCSSGSTPGTGQTYLCPDSVTRVGDLADCPTYSCWNGQSYQNPMNCPPAPAGSGSTSSGTGQ